MKHNRSTHEHKLKVMNEMFFAWTEKPQERVVWRWMSDRLCSNFLKKGNKVLQNLCRCGANSPPFASVFRRLSVSRCQESIDRQGRRRHRRRASAELGFVSSLLGEGGGGSDGEGHAAARACAPAGPWRPRAPGAAGAPLSGTRRHARLQACLQWPPAGARGDEPRTLALPGSFGELACVCSSMDCCVGFWRLQCGIRQR